MTESMKELPGFIKNEFKRRQAEINQETFPTLKEIEQMTIRKALEVTNGHKSRSAELLGISRYALYRRLKDLELS